LDIFLNNARLHLFKHEAIDFANWILKTYE